MFTDLPGPAPTPASGRGAAFSEFHGGGRYNVVGSSGGCGGGAGSRVRELEVHGFCLWGFRFATSLPLWLSHSQKATTVKTRFLGF